MNVTNEVLQVMQHQLDMNSKDMMLLKYQRKLMDVMQELIDECEKKYIVEGIQNFLKENR